MDFLDISNPFSFLSYMEDMQDNIIFDIKDYIVAHYGNYPILESEMDEVLAYFGIDFECLPQPMKNEIAELVVD